MASFSFAIPHSARPSLPYSWSGAAAAAPVVRQEPIAWTGPDAAPVVLIVDDEPAVRESLGMLVAAAGWQTETFGCALDFLARPRPAGPACLVLDATLPDIHGLELQERLAAEESPLPIVMIGSSGDVSTAVRAMKAGAVDFVTKPVDAQPLLAAVTHAIECSRTAVQAAAEIRVLRQRYATLTRREREVMEGVVVGRLNKQIAGDLDISEITVKAHRGRMMEKMRARCVPDLVNMAARLSLA